MVTIEVLAREREEMQQRQASLEAMLEGQNGTIRQLKEYIAQLEEFIRNGRRKQFGSSSEKLVENLQPNLFNEAETVAVAEEAEAVVPAEPEPSPAAQEPAPKRRRGVRIPPDLPRMEILHDLPEAEKVCPHDGTPLRQIGCEIHEQLDIVPASVQVLRHVRPTYACPCCQQHVVTATKPKQPIEKGMASPRLLATLATQKYVDAMPLHRQTQAFARIGLDLDRTTMANWMVACGALVQPLINLIQERLLEQPFLHMDETRVQVLKEPGRKAEAQSYMWVLRATLQPAVLFHYAPSRSGEIPKQMLDGFKGALMVDGYEGYNAVCEENAMARLGCWAHARRGFVDAKKANGDGKASKADEVLVFIQALYQIEGEAKEKPPDERLALRQAKSLPILQRLRQWLDLHKDRIVPKTLLGKAVHYLDQQWPRLVRYVEDGRFPIDNNPAENAIRPFVVGRKNWLFSASQRGADASANLYSLIETAKANGLEPQAYLTQVFAALPNAQTIEDIEAILPWAAGAKRQ